MRSPIHDYLTELLHSCAVVQGGAPASYIPELAEADPSQFAIGLSAVDGAVYCAGDAEVEFTIQSISKPFVYGFALEDLGPEKVWDAVDVEPSGDAFNELSLEPETGRPMNPMINAGALATHALLLPGGGVDARVERIRSGLSALAGRELEIDEQVYHSEMETAYRNRALANMLRSAGNVDLEPLQLVRGYTRQCAVRVTTRDLAIMAATLSNGGVQPWTGERVFSARVVRQVLTVMTTCGMYDSAGDWLSTVGIPAKSGVGGGIIGVLPGQAGIATFSPPLDTHGNSVRGVGVFERMTEDMGLHLMSVPPPARSVLRDDGEITTADGGRVGIYALQGAIQFAGAEWIARHLEQFPPESPTVAWDLSRTYSVNKVARRLLLEIARGLEDDGRTVVLIDPDGVIADPVIGDGRRLRVVDSLAGIVGEEALRVPAYYTSPSVDTPTPDVTTVE
ncbi:glutaminase [Tomitella fengzijianii]|uniref:glutaminase n=1 Tax=Tomitella fengzijianii TaxID=2597660 RepID=UPI00131DB992|nr:glutaminase [Tomitella fengzijianii]